MLLDRLKDPRGVSIIEVLVSVVIFATIFVSYMALYANATKSSVNNQERFTAINLAQQEIESYKQFDLSDRDINSNPFNTFPITKNVNGYTITTAIINTGLPTAISSDSNYIPIRVTVRWGNQSVSMDSYLIRITE